MLDKPGYAVLIEAPNPMEAQYIAGALENEGIPTHVDADLLADEFAMSQKMMGLQRVRVLVPVDRLEEARGVLGALRAARLEAGEEIPWDQPDGESEAVSDVRPKVPGRTAYLAWIVLLGLVAAVFAFLYWQQRSIQVAQGGSDLVYTWRVEDGKTVTRWRHNRKIAIRGNDRQGDGYEEHVEYYGRDGDLQTFLLDEDQNGVFETAWYYVKPGSRDDWSYQVLDGDQDGHYETIVYPTARGEFWRWVDENADGYWEVRELVRDKDGEVLMRHEDVREEGFKRTK